MVRIVSIVVGAITFAVLYKHEQVNRFMNEVVVELSRVTWPTQKETSSATVIVIIMVMISGLILGFLDYVWTKVVQLII
ncbi:MAG: preprotein translocase subunit SecE [Bdellovibrionales bacterium RIFOXYD1_FULL_53_11]|nr:MAG: preprotein translocase subunit SecE [Bdellovibrionales bacterium RIFOXYD1_FULL_53_11]